jgi:hypothetical protein
MIASFSCLAPVLLSVSGIVKFGCVQQVITIVFVRRAWADFVVASVAFFVNTRSSGCAPMKLAMFARACS